MKDVGLFEMEKLLFELVDGIVFGWGELLELGWVFVDDGEEGDDFGFELFDEGGVSGGRRGVS